MAEVPAVGTPTNNVVGTVSSKTIDAQTRFMMEFEKFKNSFPSNWSTFGEVSPFQDPRYVSDLPKDRKYYVRDERGDFKIDFDKYLAETGHRPKGYMKDSDGVWKFDDAKLREDFDLEKSIICTLYSLSDSIKNKNANSTIMEKFKDFVNGVSQTDEYKFCKTTKERLALINNLYKHVCESELFEDIDKHCDTGFVPQSMFLKRDITSYLEKKENVDESAQNNGSDDSEKYEALSNIHL